MKKRLFEILAIFLFFFMILFIPCWIAAVVWYIITGENIYWNVIAYINK